jgi:hypothetical protein
VFKVKNVIVKVDSLKKIIRDWKHDFLYTSLKPLAAGLVKRQIQKVADECLASRLVAYMYGCNQM